MPRRRDDPFHLYIDEFQNFTTDTFASAFSETRKAALSLTVAHQYIGQLSDTVRDAVFGNVGNIVAFRVSGEDATVLSRQIPEFSPGLFRGPAAGGSVREPPRARTGDTAVSGLLSAATGASDRTWRHRSIPQPS